MFSSIKKSKFNNQVNSFRNFINSECIAKHKEQGLLDEMYTISIYGKGVCATAEENGTIRIIFRKGILCDKNFNVSFNIDLGTMVHCMNDSGNLELLEFDANNSNQLFLKYIDLFLKSYAM